MAAQPEVLVEVADVLGHAARQRVDVRRDEPDLHRPALAVGVLEARRPEVAARVAVVPAGPVAAQPAADLGPRVPATLAQLAPEGPELPRRAVEAPVVARGCAPGWRPAASSSVRPGNVVQPVPIASDAWASLLPTWARLVLRGEAHDAFVPVPPERRGVERLDRVGPDGGVRIVEQAAQQERLGAQRVRDEGWAGIAMPPCSWTAAMDQRRLRRAGTGRSRNRPSRWPPRVLISSPTITRVRQPAIEGDPAGRERGVDPLVIGDRDDVEHALALDAVEDLGDRRRPVGGERVDVEIGAAEPVDGVRLAVPCRHPAPSWSRSGQIGWNAPHHCSGASASSVSSVAATAAVWAMRRSRRVPPSGSGTRTTRHR